VREEDALAFEEESILLPSAFEALAALILSDEEDDTDDEAILGLACCSGFATALPFFDAAPPS